MEFQIDNRVLMALAIVVLLVLVMSMCKHAEGVFGKPPRPVPSFPRYEGVSDDKLRNLLPAYAGKSEGYMSMVKPKSEGYMSMIRPQAEGYIPISEMKKQSEGFCDSVNTRATPEGCCGEGFDVSKLRNKMTSALKTEGYTENSPTDISTCANHSVSEGIAGRWARPKRTEGISGSDAKLRSLAMGGN